VQKRPAEREPLQLAARKRGGPLAPRLPEPEALEQHPDPLTPFRNAIEPAVEVEVLERRQLTVDERLVRKEADPAAVGLDVERAARRDGEPGAKPQQRRLPGPVRPGDDEEATPPELEVDSAQDALEPVPLLEARRPDQTSTSASTNRKNPTEMTPFIVKNAVSSRRKSPGRTSECSYASSSPTAATPSQ